MINDLLRFPLLKGDAIRNKYFQWGRIIRTIQKYIIPADEQRRVPVCV